MALFGGNRSVSVALKADVSGYLASMRVAQKATADFGRAAGTSARKNKADWQSLGAGMGVAGAAIGAGLAVAVKAAADFDKQLSAVRAVSNATAGDMDRLRGAALKAGADTKFSASEAAKAETELAKVGLSTADILGGALNGSLSLAAAGQLDLGRAAEVSGQAMKIFGLQGRDVGHIADVLSAGANKSAADVDQLAQAMSQGGLVAAQTGLSLEDTVGALSAFADNALMGSDAGTSLKTMLQRLNPTSDAAATLMDQLGLRAYDAQGNFVGLAQYAGQLQKGMAGLSVEQRNAAMSTIFGSDAVRASNILFKLGAEGVNQYTNAVNDQGAAARVAARQMDNLSGDFEQLRGSIETALIKAGSAGNESLRGLTQTATKAVNAFGSLPDSVQSAAFGFAAVGSAALLAGGAVLTIVPKVAATKASLDALGVSSVRTSAALKGLGVAVGVVAVAAGANMLGSWIGEAQVAKVKTDDLAASLGGLAARGQLSAQGLRLFGDGFGPLANGADTTGEALKNFGINAYNALDQGWDARLARVQSFGSATAQFGSQVSQVDGALASMVQAGNADQAAAAFARLRDSAVAQGVPVSVITAQFKQYQAALDNAAVAGKGAAGSTDQVGGSAAVATPKVKSQVDVIKDLSAALDVLESHSFDAAEAADNFHSKLNGLKEAAKANGTSMKGNSDKAIANREAMRGAARAAFEAIDKYAQNGHTQEQVKAKAARYREELRKQAIQAGFSKTDVARYTGVLNKVPDAVKTSFSTPGLDSATGKVKTLRQAILDIPSRRNISIGVATGIANKVASQNNRLTRAYGGYISGPGGPTEDAIPAYLSNGEYVVRASSVQKYGTEMLDMLNAGRFANGGQVGEGTKVVIKGHADLSNALSPVVQALRQATDAVRASAAAGAGGIGGGGGANMGWRRQWAIVHGAFPGAQLTSSFRPGAITATGNVSYHSKGRAIDVTPSMAIFNWIRSHYGRSTKELIYSPAGGRQLHNGSPHMYTGITRAMHFNHVHWAMNRGGKVGAQSAPRRPLPAARFATGGPVTGGDYPGIQAIVAARQVWSKDDLKQRIAYAAQWDDAAANAAKALAKARHDLAKAHTRAAKREAREEVEQARDRLVKARSRARDADRATANVALGLKLQARPLGVRFAEAAESRNRVTAGFLRNLGVLADRGFGNLARQLQEMGGPDAEVLASQAVRSVGTARRLQSDLTASAKLQAREAGLPGELAIRSALRTDRNPTLAGIAAATGLSVSDLQTSLRAISGSLKGNRNAKSLLAGIRSQGFYSNGSFGATTAAAGPTFQITVQNPSGDPYRAGEKAAQGVQRVLAVQGAW